MIRPSHSPWLIIAAALAACGGGSDPECNPLPTDVTSAVAAVFGPAIALISGEQASIAGITMTVADDNRSATIDFANYTDSATSISVNGRLDLAIAVDDSTAELDINGTVTLAGSSIVSLRGEVHAVLPWDPISEDFAGEPQSISGSVTADDLACGVQQFPDVFGGGGGDDPVTNPDFLAPGGGGTIALSGDGSRWGYPDVLLAEDTGTSVDLWGVDCGSTGHCVVVGDGGNVLHTDDGLTWTAGSSGIATGLRAVAHGDGTWMAVGTNGVILQSTDGRSFTSVSSPTSEELRDVDYGAGHWVAVGRGGTIVHGTTPASLSAASLPNPIVIDGLTSDGDGHWVAVGEGGLVMLSDDHGVTFTASPAPISANLAGVAFGDGRYVAVGQGLSGWGIPPVVYTSEDHGVSWTAAVLPDDLLAVSPARPLGDVATDGAGTWSVLGLGGDHLLSTDGALSFTVAALDKYAVQSIAYRP